MDFSQAVLAAIFFGIALLYSMAGFGGGSSYLAVLTLAGVAHTAAPQIALLCNVLVAGLALFWFRREGHFKFRAALPFVALSVPAAYLGSLVPLSKEVFCALLAVSLGIAAIRIFLADIPQAPVGRTESRNLWLFGAPLGALLGFFSGVVGIGGGIFLSPILILTRRAGLKEASGIAAVFIVANSISGLCGHWSRSGAAGLESVWFLAPAALIGGQCGARIGSGRVPVVVIRRVLSGILAIVALRLAGIVPL